MAHDHSHTHGDASTVDTPKATAYEPREPLPRGSGTGKILFLDGFSGLAGDMVIAALLDLGVPISVVADAVAQLPIGGYELVVAQRERSGIVATKFDVKIEREQPHRNYGGIDDMLEASSLDDATKSKARAIFRRLGEAEAAAHRMPLRQVHFHEVGAVDAIVDIVGAAAAMSYLDAEVVASPLPMGRGFVQAQHGVLPLPAPATVNCLRGVPTYAVELDAELVTPTGAAIVSACASRFTRWPTMTPEHVGFGSGTMDLLDRPNLLRVVLGSEAGHADTSHVVLEANVDDMTGELAAHAINAALQNGAVDAWATPITMKKGRPALVMSALAPRASATRVAETLLRETTTIGVRTTDVSRIERPRTTVEVETPYGKISLKVSGGGHGPAQVKPEFDRCAEAAQKHGVPVRVVLQAALSAYERS